MKASALLVAALPLLLAACATTGARPAACPADFETFLERFVDDPAFQREWTAPTIVSTEGNPGGRPETITRRVGRGDLRFPVIPPRAERQKDKLQSAVQKQGAAKAVYKLWLPDSDAFALDYVFERDRCWRLVRIDDNAL